MLACESKWTYNTSTTGGIGVEFLAASGGRILLTDPQKHDHSYWYLGGGVGYGADIGGRKIVNLKGKSIHVPKLPPLRIAGHQITAGGSLDITPSTGWVFKNNILGNRELNYHDFRGATIYVEGGFGTYIAGVSVSIMALGMSPLTVASAIGNPLGAPVLAHAILTAPAYLATVALNVGGFQIGGGVAALAGVMI